MCPSYSLCSRFGKSVMQNFSFINKVFYCTSNIFNRNVWVYTVLIQKVYAICTQTF